MVLYWGGSELLGNEWFVKCRCLHLHCLIGWVQWMCCGWVSCVDQVVQLHSSPCEVTCPTDTGDQWQSDKTCLQCPSQPCSGRLGKASSTGGASAASLSHLWAFWHSLFMLLSVTTKGGVWSGPAVWRCTRLYYLYLFYACAWGSSIQTWPSVINLSR